MLRHSSSHLPATSLCVLDDGGLETLGVLDVDRLDVRVQLLLGTLLVVTLTGDADAQAERNALDAGLPHLLVELGVEADVAGALQDTLALLRQKRNTPDCKSHNDMHSSIPRKRAARTIAFVAKALISLMALGALFLNETP